MSDFQLTRAVSALNQGGVIAHATEGVWGLACDPFEPAAVARIIQLKGRSERRGFILIGADPVDFELELSVLDDVQRKRVLTSWPGAHTHVLPKSSYPVWVSPHLNPTGFDQRRASTVAARVTGHPQVQALCRRFGGVLLSTSANPTGQPAATTALRVRRYFDNALDYLLPGQVLVPGAASAISDALTGEWIRKPLAALAFAPTATTQNATANGRLVNE